VVCLDDNRTLTWLVVRYNEELVLHVVEWLSDLLLHAQEFAELLFRVNTLDVDYHFFPLSDPFFIWHLLEPPHAELLHEFRAAFVQDCSLVK
jgi:hypothetical protein